MKNTGKQSTKSVVSDALMMLPLGLAVGLVPLIVRYVEFSTNLDNYGWFGFGAKSADFFLLGKVTVLLIVTVVMLLLVAYKWFMEDLKWKNSALFIPLGIYFAITLLSTLMSEYRYFGLHGISDQFESIWVIASYCICAYYAYLFVSTLAQLKILSVYFIVGSCIINVLGLTQSLDKDFFQTGFGMKLITPESMWNNLDTLTFNFPTRYVYSTLYNPNYVGTYLAMTIPILCIMILCYKDIKKKIGLGVLLLVSFCNLYYCRSQGGQIAFACSLILVLLCIALKLPKKGKAVAGAGILAAAIACCLLVFVPASPVHAKLAAYFAKSPEPHMTALSCDNSGVHFTYDGDSYTVTYTKEGEGYVWLTWLDGDGNGIESKEITLADGSTAYTVPDKPYSDSLYIVVTDFSTILQGLNGITLHSGEFVFYFTNELDGTYQYINNMGRFDNIVSAESAVFTEHGNLFSGRGFLWAKTIPMLKDYFIIGAGADTYTLLFPNNDYLDKANNGYYTLTVTKPHCLYLQIGVQSGVLALLAFLAFQVWYLVQSLLVWIRNDWKRPETLISFGIAVGVVAYLITGIINDSCVAVAPVYWCLIGVGCAVNGMLLGSKVSGQK